MTEKGPNAVGEPDAESGGTVPVCAVPHGCHGYCGSFQLGGCAPLGHARHQTCTFTLVAIALPRLPTRTVISLPATVIAVSAACQRGALVSEPS